PARPQFAYLTGGNASPRIPARLFVAGEDSVMGKRVQITLFYSVLRRTPARVYLVTRCWYSVFFAQQAGAAAPACCLPVTNPPSSVRLPAKESGNLELVVFLVHARLHGKPTLIVELAAARRIELRI